MGRKAQIEWECDILVKKGIYLMMLLTLAFIIPQAAAVTLYNATLNATGSNTTVFFDMSVTCDFVDVQANNITLMNCTIGGCFKSSLFFSTPNHDDIISTYQDCSASAASGLGVIYEEVSWLTLNWTNPSEPDFSYNEVYLDGVLYDNTTGTKMNVSGLYMEVEYNFTVRSYDNLSNYNETGILYTINNTGASFTPNATTLCWENSTYQHCTLAGGETQPCVGWTNFWDANYSTLAYLGISGGDSYAGSFEENFYRHPYGTNATIRWKACGADINVSVNQTCYEQNESSINFLYGRYVSGVAYTYLYCYINSTTTTLMYTAINSPGACVYEAAICQDIRYPIYFTNNTHTNETYHYFGENNFIYAQTYMNDTEYNYSVIRLYNETGSEIENVTSYNIENYGNFTDLPLGTYYLNATAYNHSGSAFSSTETRVIPVYENVVPVITIEPGNEFTSTNLSTKNPYDDLLELDLNFTDNLALYAYRINITKDGTIYYNETNTSLSGTYFNLLKNISLSSWPNGTYNIEILLADAHTKKEIKDYDISTEKNRVFFRTTEKNLVRIESEEESTITAHKDVDRYSFRLNFDKKGKRDRRIDITTQFPLIYLPDSEFKGHFVSFQDFSGNWIDFEGFEGDIDVEQINPTHYAVYLRDAGPAVELHSIGGLNVLGENYTFYRGTQGMDVPLAYRGDPTTLTLNFTTDNSTIGDIDVALFYNGTEVTNVNKTTSTGLISFTTTFDTPETLGDYSVLWLVNVTESDSSIIEFNVSATQSVYDFGIVACNATEGNVTLILNYFNENEPATSEEVSMEIDLQAWIGNPLNTFNYSAEFATNHTHYICLYPGNATIQADVYVKYEVNGGFVHRYYFVNHTFTNESQSMSLYNFNDTTGISGLKITTRYVEDFSYFQNVIVKLQRLYVGEGVWRTVQMDESGDFGGIFFNIREKDTDYKMIFMDRQNNVLKTTETIKFVCDSGLCDITYLLDPYEATAASDDINLSVTYDNNTRVLNLTWSDGSGNTRNVRMGLWKSTITGYTYLCTTNQTGAGGSFGCNASLYEGEAFLSVIVDDEPVYGEYVELGKSTFAGFIDKSESALWTAGIVITTVGFGLFSPVAAVLAAVAGLVFAFWLGINSFITITFIIVAGAVGVAIGLKVKT